MTSHKLDHWIIKVVPNNDPNADGRVICLYAKPLPPWIMFDDQARLFWNHECSSEHVVSMELCW